MGTICKWFQRHQVCIALTDQLPAAFGYAGVGCMCHDSRTFKNNPTIILYLCLRQPLIQGNIRLDRASYRLFEQYILPCADVAAFFPQEEAHDQSPPEREDDKPTFSIMNIIARI